MDMPFDALATGLQHADIVVSISVVLCEGFVAVLSVMGL